MSIAEDNTVQETPAKSSVSDVLNCNTNINISTSNTSEKITEQYYIQLHIQSTG